MKVRIDGKNNSIGCLVIQAYQHGIGNRSRNVVVAQDELKEIRWVDT